MTTHYEVTVGFVDTSYWDDGDRPTLKRIKFEKRNDAIAFILTTLEHGLTTDGRGGTLQIRPPLSDIRLFEIKTKECDLKEILQEVFR